MITKSQINITVLDDERKAWNGYAERHDTSVARLIRAFMNGLVTGKIPPPPIMERINEQEPQRKNAA